MPLWPVSHHDGVYQVTDRDGVHYPITMMGEPVRDLLPGWYPLGLQTGLPPFHLLELRRDSDGQDAVWYLTEELAFITHTAAHFDKTQTDTVVERLSPLLRDIYDQSICAEYPLVADSSHGFDGIASHGIRELIGLVVEAALSPPSLVMADQIDAAGTELSAGLIRHSLDIVVPQTPQGGLRLASPFDASLLDAQEAFAPEACAPDGGALRQAYRFRDREASVTLYLLAGNSGQPALYIPTMNTIFATDREISSVAVMTMLLCYYATHTGRVVSQAEEHPPAPVPPPGNWWKRMFGLGHA